MSKPSIFLLDINTGKPDIVGSKALGLDQIVGWPMREPLESALPANFVYSARVAVVVGKDIVSTRIPFYSQVISDLRGAPVDVHIDASYDSNSKIYMLIMRMESKSLVRITRVYTGLMADWGLLTVKDSQSVLKIGEFYGWDGGLDYTKIHKMISVGEIDIAVIDDFRDRKQEQGYITIILVPQSLRQMMHIDKWDGFTPGENGEPDRYYCYDTWATTPVLSIAGLARLVGKRTELLHIRTTDEDDDDDR